MIKIGERLGQLITLGSPEGQTERFSRKEVGDLNFATYMPPAFSMSSCFFLQEIQ